MTVPLERQKNIADVAPRVRDQLGLGSAAVSNSGDFATAAQGEKADNSAQKEQNLLDLTEPKTALLNLGLDAYPVAKYGTITGGDNSAVINAAINAAYAAGGGTVILPTGTTTASTIILKDKVRLVPSGRGSSLLNIGSATYFLRAEGSLGANVSLTADAAAGATQLVIASTAGIAANDYLVITDGYSYAATDATYKSGETVQVKSVDSSTQVTLVGALYGSIAPGGAYTTANSAKINRISPIIAPSIEDVEFLGDFGPTTTAIHAMYVLNGKFSPRVKHWGNSGLLLRGVIDTDVFDGIYDDILDDQVNGHSGYAIAAAGPTLGLRVTNNGMTRCRHGFTTIGGVTGFPHNVKVSINTTRDTSQAGLDTHAAGDDILFEVNDVSRSGGSGITIRSRNTRLVSNDIDSVAVHGIALAEDILSDVTLDDNNISRAAQHGISCAVSCKNLKITKQNVSNVGADGITLFSSGTSDSTGLIVSETKVLGYGLSFPNRAGLITSGPVGSTGAIIGGGNLFGPLAGSANYGIRTLNLSGSAVVDNSAFGTFGVTPFDTGSNVSLGNKRVDGSVAQIQLDYAGATIRSIGPNTNEDILIIPKGSGRLRFGAWTTNADAAVNGYVEIKSADGTVRKLATIA